MRKVLWATLFVVMLLSALPSYAQSPNYDVGPVWRVTYYHLKPGQGEAYWKDVREHVKPVFESLKKEGLISDYKFWLNDTTDHPGRPGTRCRRSAVSELCGVGRPRRQSRHHRRQTLRLARRHDRSGQETQRPPRSSNEQTRPRNHAQVILQLFPWVAYPLRRSKGWVRSSSSLLPGCRTLVRFKGAGFSSLHSVNFFRGSELQLRHFRSPPVVIPPALSEAEGTGMADFTLPFAPRERRPWSGGTAATSKPSIKPHARATNSTVG